jgi:hypothetical protein
MFGGRSESPGDRPSGACEFALAAEADKFPAAFESVLEQIRQVAEPTCRVDIPESLAARFA